jgi:hypothetical protein
MIDFIRFQTDDAIDEDKILYDDLGEISGIARGGNDRPKVFKVRFSRTETLYVGFWKQGNQFCAIICQSQEEADDVNNY